MRTSLVLPTWNAGSLLEEVLDAVDAQPGADGLERIAVDSGSTDGTVDVLRAHGFEVHAIEQRSFNHGATRDLAIQKSSGDLVLLLTQDATPQQGWLTALRQAFEDPSIDAAWCHQLARPDANPLLRRRIAEWMGDRASKPRQQLASGQKLEDLEPLQRLDLCAFDNVASAVRRTSWQRFPFGWRKFGEDVAFGKRVIESGGAIQFAADARVVHSHDTHTEQEGRRIYCDHANLRQLFGVRTIPTVEACRAAIRGGRRHFAKLVADEPDLSVAERARLHRWAMDYVGVGIVGAVLGRQRSRAAARSLRAAAAIDGPGVSQGDLSVRLVIRPPPGGIPSDLGAPVLPGSKSHTQRAMLITGMGSGRWELPGALAAEDTEFLALALQAIGARCSWPEQRGTGDSAALW